MNKNKRGLKPKHILIILTLVCALLLLLSFVSTNINNAVRSTLNTFLMPMQNGLNKIGGFVSDKAENVANFSDLEKQNEDMKEELAFLRMQVARYQLQDKEINEYKNLLDMKTQYEDYETIGAHVIGENSTNWNKTVLIDRGSSDGIKKDMNVISQGGLVGIVTSVTSNSATVRTIADQDCMVGAMEINSKDSCIVRGDIEIYNKGLLILEKINKDSKIEDNSKIVTNNKSSVFLPGILIGYAKNIKLNSNSITKSGYVTPVVDFTHLDGVLVIKNLKENGKWNVYWCI